MTPRQEESLAERRLKALKKARKVKAANAKAGERDAVSRVRKYLAWCRAGSPTSSVPEIPTNGDFTVARRRGVVR